MRSCLPSLLSLLTLVPALAMGATSAPVWVVGQCQGGADKEAFIQQVAHQASAWTAREGFELCGRLARDEQGNWGMTLTTNYSQLTCLAVDRLSPSGFTATPEQFHTHPVSDNGRLVLHDYTRQLASELGQVLPSESTVVLPNPGGFSPQDIDHGGGYLAAEGRLLVHRDGKTQDLGAIETAPPVCRLTR